MSTSKPKSKFKRYMMHLKECWHLSLQSLTASFVFFVHGINPKWWDYSGTALVHSMNKKVSYREDVGKHV